MAIRTAAHVAAGVLAGAVLAGVPTWAVASQDDVDSSTSTDMSQMMSDGQPPDQMMRSMSSMMKDSAMRKEMVSMMSEAMGEMSSMGSDGAHHSKSGMGRMHGKDPSGASSDAPKP